jgi:hypothetical protein
MLKEKLEILVERLSDRDAAQREYALKEFKTEIAGATSSMTSVPKPLKFLSPHYKRIVEIYELQIDGEFKVSRFRKSDFEQQFTRFLDSINQILAAKIRRLCLSTWNGCFGRRQTRLPYLLYPRFKTQSS